MGSHDRRFPGESAECREARNRLLKAEAELREHVERVATMRRELPLGGRLETDYVFEEIPPGSSEVRSVKLSELFSKGHDSLLLYNLMFGSDWEKACPMCTSLVDGYNGVAPYVNERANLVIVGKAPAAKLRAWADGRGWKHRVISSGNNSFNQDYNAEFPSEYGDQHPVMQVFVRRDGEIRHFWSSELLYVETEGQPRHMDLTWPLWNLLDLTPEGRGTSWHPEFQL